jgi:hypothetical protein
LVALAVAACAGPEVTPSPAQVVLPNFSVSNETTVPVTIAINGIVVGTLPAGSAENPIPAVLPSRPWTVEARSPSGRVLDTLTVTAQDYLAKFARADLACGRIDIWSGGPQPLGPAVSPDPSRTCD